MPQEDGEGSTPPADPERRRHWRMWISGAALILIMGAAVLLALLLGRPGVSLSFPSESLVQVHVHGIAKLTGMRATDADRIVSLARRADGLVPTTQLAQGETVRIVATVAPPAWLKWLLGPAVSTTATIRTPTASPTAGVAATSVPGHVPVHFDHPVQLVEYRSAAARFSVIHLAKPASVVDLAVPTELREGSLQIAAAPRPWELATAPIAVTWFVAPAGGASVLAEPVPGSTDAAMNAPIILTFDEPVTEALGDERPSVSPAVAGAWSEPGPDTLVFTPSQEFGYGPGAAVSVRLPRSVAILGSNSRSIYHFGVRPGSLLRLEQILAGLHYLPLDFVPATGVPEPTTFAAEVAAIDTPLAGSFTWRWASTPAELRSKWSPGLPTAMLRGALMAFDATGAGYDGYQADDETVAQLADPATWKRLLEDAVSNRLDPFPYSYVYVSESLPETLTLWEDGKVVLKSRANTGISEEPTVTGTYPIYIRYAENYMSGTNPNGSSYDDLVQWINYFNGGDAVHGFVRGSYGFPQSLGCVELPVPTAAQAFPHLAIGDLVTVVS
jgi:L,D-transpeptidase catalytic domain